MPSLYSKIIITHGLMAEVLARSLDYVLWYSHFKLKTLAHVKCDGISRTMILQFKESFTYLLHNLQGVDKIIGTLSNFLKNLFIMELDLF